jgi:putative hydrolase of the HAD superfamily
MPIELPPVLFVDLDDTVINYEGSTRACWECACGEGAERLGIEPPALLQAVTEYGAWYWSDAGRHREGRQDLRTATIHIVEEALTRLGTPSPEVARLVGNRYRDLREEDICCFPGALEALVELQTRGVRMAMITNGAGPAQRLKIDRFELARYFECIVIEGEFGVGKPEEAVYRHALTAMGADPRETWMVGDNLEWDVGAPQRLGISGVWVDLAGQGLPADSLVQPHRIVRALCNLVQADS